MYEPEFCGRVVFVDQLINKTLVSQNNTIPINEEMRQALFNLHRAQIDYLRTTGGSAKDLQQVFKAIHHYLNGDAIDIALTTLPSRQGYQGIIKSPINRSTVWHIDQTGRIWKKAL